jgi:hypothetical protein
MGEIWKMENETALALQKSLFLLFIGYVVSPREFSEVGRGISDC